MDSTHSKPEGLVAPWLGSAHGAAAGGGLESRRGDASGGVPFEVVATDTMRVLGGGLVLGLLAPLILLAAAHLARPSGRFGPGGNAPSPIPGSPSGAPSSQKSDSQKPNAEKNQELPRLLSATGLYETGPAGTEPSRKLHPDVVAYSPAYPLWTDGAAKRRYLRLPPGTAIDGSDPDHWVFPVGTQLWKEFSFGRRVETRYIERARDGSWRFAAYVWDAAEKDAEIAPGGARGVAELPGSSLRHDVPSEQDCGACHGGRSSPVLGVTLFQLGSEPAARAPRGEAPASDTLDVGALVERGLLRGLPQGRAAARLAAPSDEARAAAGYLYGNCSHCHNSEGSLRELGLDFDQSLTRPGSYERMTASVVEQTSRFRLPGEENSLRVAPGAPERSAVYVRASSRFPAWQMPPLGTQLKDDTAVELLARWIETLESPALPLKKDPT
jgi:hypothetical protein